MRRIADGRVVPVLLVLLGTACHRGHSPEPPLRIESHELFTCCNIHYERDGDEVTDANYWVGETLPAGTPVKIESAREDAVKFLAGPVRLTLKHQYGTDEEPLQKYVDKVLVASDPRPRLAAYSSAVRRAIGNGKVERGMTRDQVIASLGYPPTHRTASTKEHEWTYWYNRWSTYRVVFDDTGKVSDVVGRPAPTAELAIDRAEAPGKPHTGPGHSRKGKTK